MINDFLEKQWKKIEGNTRVISIKNLTYKLSLSSGEDSITLAKKIRGYYLKKNDALFVNENQIIDTKTLDAMNVVNLGQLITVLKEKFFIYNIDIKNVATYISLGIGSYKSKYGDKSDISYPPDLFRNFYRALAKHRITKNVRSYKAKLIREYFTTQDNPKSVFDIYSDLAGVLFEFSISDIQDILKRHEEFTYLKDGYWVSESWCNNLNRRFLITKVLLEEVFNTSPEKLLSRYISKSKHTNLIPMLEILDIYSSMGINISKLELEEILINLGYIEIYPQYWTANKGNVISPLFNLTERLQQTSKIIGFKNKSHEKVFYQRIIGSKTLEEVGVEIGVTRERVRQIEIQIRKRMGSSDNSYLIRPFYNWVEDKLKAETILVLSDLGAGKDDYDAFVFIMNNYFESKVSPYEVFDNIIIYKPEYNRLAIEISKLGQENKIIDLKNIPFRPGFSKKVDLYKKVLTDGLGLVDIGNMEYYYSNGNLTKEEELYIIIYKTGKPLHFTEAHKKAELFKLPLTVEPGRNTLATMQRSNLLKRVAPGRYALREWDIPSHIFIKDLIYKVLLEANKPLSYEQIYKEVKRNRNDQIKEKSFQYYLSCHEEIIYIYTKQYILLEWTEEPRKLINHGIDRKRIENKRLLNNPKNILSVFKKGKGFITKYRLSEATLQSSYFRVSRYVKLNFDRRIVIIDKNNIYNFNSYSSDIITGIGRWTYVPKTNEVFYMEFINEKVARFLSTKEFENYVPIKEDVLREAEEFWHKQMGLLLANEEKDEEVIIDILTLEDLITFGLKNGYVYYETIEELVEQGYHPKEVIYELENRDIIINY